MVYFRYVDTNGCAAKWLWRICWCCFSNSTRYRVAARKKIVSLFFPDIPWAHCARLYDSCYYYCGIQRPPILLAANPARPAVCWTGEVNNPAYYKEKWKKKKSNDFPVSKYVGRKIQTSPPFPENATNLVRVWDMGVVQERTGRNVGSKDDWTPWTTVIPSLDH